MTFPLSRYFAVALALTTAWVAAQNVVVGGAYLLASLALLLPLVLFRVPRRFFFVMLFTAVAIFISHMLRPLILIPFPELFTYGNLGVISPRLIAVVLVKLSAYSVLMMGGIWLGFRLIGSPGAAELAERGEADDESEGVNTLVRAQLLVIGLMVVLLAVRAYLQFGEGLFTKLAEPHPTIGFMAELVPELLIYGVGALYLFKYRWQIGAGAWWVVLLGLVALVVMSLLSGSKGFLARIGATVFIFFLADRGDFELRPSRALLVALVAAWAMVMSFAVARPVRPIVGGQGYTIEVTEAIARGAREAVELDPENLIYQANAVTRRFNGLDGLLATELEQPETLRRVFRLRNVLVRIAGRLLPRLDLGGEFTSGEAVGVFYSGHSIEVRHAGGVGVFGALRLAAGEAGSYGLAFLLGVFWAACFRATDLARDPDLRLLLQLVGAMAIIAWTMSGNFDVAVASSIVDLAHLFFYGGLVLVMASPLQKRHHPGRVEASA